MTTEQAAEACVIVLTFVVALVNNWHAQQMRRNVREQNAMWIPRTREESKLTVWMRFVEENGEFHAKGIEMNLKGQMTFRSEQTARDGRPIYIHDVMFQSNGRAYYVKVNSWRIVEPKEFEDGVNIVPGNIFRNEQQYWLAEPVAPGGGTADPFEQA